MVALAVLVGGLLVNRIMIQHVTVITGNDHHTASLASSLHHVPEQGHGFKRPIDLNLRATGQLIIDRIDHHRQNSVLRTRNYPPNVAMQTARSRLGQILLMEHLRWKLGGGQLF
ncbi:hypothetical protein D9M68_787390 [compost metagenome]